MGRANAKAHGIQTSVECAFARSIGEGMGNIRTPHAGKTEVAIA